MLLHKSLKLNHGLLMNLSNSYWTLRCYMVDCL